MATRSRTGRGVVGLRSGTPGSGRRRRSRTASLALAVLLLALALAACSSSAATPTPPPLPSPSPSGLTVVPASIAPTATEMASESPTATSSESPTPTSSATATASSGSSGDDNDQGSCGGGLECGLLTPQPSTGMFVAVNSLRQATNYKFSMTLVGAAADPNTPGADFAYALSQLAPSASCGGAPYTVKGTIANQQAGPTANFESVFDADITCPGLHIIKVGSSMYVDQGGTGKFSERPLDDPYELDFLSPAHLVESYVDPHLASHYTLVGSETKDGVSTDHYRSDQALDEEVEGGQYDTWSADLWLAKAGGYPISMDVVAKESDGGKPYEISFDITNANDPANKVTAPAT